MKQSGDEPILLHGTRFNVHQMQLIGSDGKTYQREVIRHPGAVVLLPLIDRDTVVLIENRAADRRSVAVGASGGNP